MFRVPSYAIPVLRAFTRITEWRSERRQAAADLMETASDWRPYTHQIRLKWQPEELRHNNHLDIIIIIIT